MLSGLQRNGVLLLSVLAGLAVTVSCNKAETSELATREKTVVRKYTPDVKSNLKNPYMGWTLYSDCVQQTDRPALYWYLQDEAAEYAGVLYLRWRWSDLEPEEGKYAWNENEDFKGMIQGALDRGLRLAFRVYVNGRDNLHPATPQYVLDGAETYTVDPGHQTPYADDEFFLEKYTKFIEAFGKKFNDPAIVDYVDSYGLGWWGEESHIQYLDASNKWTSHDRIVRAYEKAFSQVINVVNWGVRDGRQTQVAFDELKFTPRRDGYASMYFPKGDQENFVKHFPECPLIAEACYWGGGEMSGIEGGRWSSWAAYYKDVVDLALATHANYLDLRTSTEARRYLDVARTEVDRFVSMGGYRIYPTEISYTQKSDRIELSHRWTNIGVGVLPNNNVHLKYKYKVMFALFDKDKNIVRRIGSENIEVSRLVGDIVLSADDVMELSGLDGGEYTLCVGIINTIENDSKDITLAVKRANRLIGEWLVVDTINL